MQHSVPAIAQALPFPRPASCAVAGMAMQARKAIDAYTFADRNDDKFKQQVMDSAAVTLRNIEDASGFMLAASPEGALFQVCALIGHADNALDFVHEDSMAAANIWVTRLITGLQGLLQYLENEHGINRNDLGLDWYCSRHLQDRDFPVGAA